VAPNREYDIRKPLPKQQRSSNCTEKTRTQVFCRQWVPEHLAAAVVVGQAKQSPAWSFVGFRAVKGGAQTSKKRFQGVGRYIHTLLGRKIIIK